MSTSTSTSTSTVIKDGKKITTKTVKTTGPDVNIANFYLKVYDNIFREKRKQRPLSKKRTLGETMAF